MINGTQIRMARAALNWSREQLSEKTDISLNSIKRIEDEVVSPRESTIKLIYDVFDAAGIEFTERSGVRLKTDLVYIYEGEGASRKFFEEVYNTARTVGGEFIVSGVDELQFDQALGDYLETYTSNMKRLKTVNFRVLVSEDDNNPAAEDYINYRKIPRELFTTVPFYIYGNKLAIIVWEPKPRYIIHNDVGIVDAYRKQFEMVWRQGKPV